MKLPSQTVGWDPQEESDSSVSSDRTLQTPSWSSSEQRTAERREASSRRYSHLDLLMEAGTSPESSESSGMWRAGGERRAEGRTMTVFENEKDFCVFSRFSREENVTAFL